MQVGYMVVMSLYAAVNCKSIDIGPSDWVARVTGVINLPIKLDDIA